MTKKLFLFIPVVILLLAFSLRFWHIASVAPGISGDEVDYPLNAKSFYLTGKDLENAIHPLDVLTFQYPKNDDVKAELDYLLLMPFVGPFPFSLALERILFVLLSVATVFLIYQSAKELFGVKTGIIAGFLGAINPFLVVLGRTTYEVVPATFFFLLSFYLALKLRGAKILLLLPILLCGFYAYIATKLLFVPFVILLCLFGYYYVQKKKDGMYYFALAIMCILFTILYVFLISHIHGERLGTLLTPNSSAIPPIVNSERNASLQGPLTTYTINKITIYGQMILQNLFPIFSTTSLFIQGDGFFRLYNFGVLYYLDGLFLLLGMVFLFREKPKLGLFLLGFIFLSTLPQIFYTSNNINTNYSHSTLMFPFLVMLSACGAGGMIACVKNKTLKNITMLCIVLLYAVSTVFFIQAYFYQYPLRGESDYATRLLSKYISLATMENKKVVVLSTVSSSHFKKYLFYANALNAQTISQVKQAFSSGNIRLGNVTFTSCANKPNYPKNTIFIEDAVCGTSVASQHTTIPLILDGGAAYTVYHDSVCSSFNLKPYPSDLTISDLNVENMPLKQFCETFITSN